MSPFERLLAATAAERAEFLAIPVIRQATQAGVPLPMYLDFLGQAYHHVKHTCGLLSRAAARCGAELSWLRDAFLRYIDEEKGHEAWIVDDIAALGGDGEAVRRSEPRAACATMVRRAYDSIDTEGPIAMLGMIHVLEGMSVLLAERAADSIRKHLHAPESGAGFRYLSSHGALDREHVAFFETLVNRLDSPVAERQLIDSARAMYRLYGGIFRDIAQHAMASGHAA